MSAVTLYEDRYITLTDQGVTIKWYYFPIGKAKHIAWGEVKAFRYEPINLFTSKGWGMGFSNVWWASDVVRQFSCNQAKFLSLTVSNEGRRCKCNIRKGFSCENLKKVRDIMKKYVGPEKCVLQA